jgi:hypothetical protein
LNEYKLHRIKKRDKRSVFLRFFLVIIEMQRYGLDMIRRGALRACFQLTEQGKKYLLLIAGLFMLGLMGRFFFQASDAPLASEPYQKGGVYE